MAVKIRLSRHLFQSSALRHPCGLVVVFINISKASVVSIFWERRYDGGSESVSRVRNYLPHNTESWSRILRSIWWGRNLCCWWIKATWSISFLLYVALTTYYTVTYLGVCCVTFKTGFGFDGWIYWHLTHITRNYRQFSAIADLHTFSSPLQAH
jgi:hypothetical protein